MSRRKKDPLRPLADAEQRTLGQLSRSQVAPAVQVARASMLLAVAAGSDYQQAARQRILRESGHGSQQSRPEVPWKRSEVTGRSSRSTGSRRELPRG